MPTLWILEDQLALDLSSLKEHRDAPVLLIESRRYFREHWFHKRRIGFLVAAMRHHAIALRDAGRDVAHYGLDRPGGYLDSISALRDYVGRTGERHFVVVDPSEWHTRAWIESLRKPLGIDVEFLPNDLFLTDRVEFASWARKLKSPIMENFYRRMRPSTAS